MKFSKLWTWEGTVDRGPYASVGLIGFAVKHNIDRLIATLVFHRSWSLFNYWFPLDQAVQLSSLSHSDRVYLLTMLAISMPFIWIGVVLTMRRLRAIRFPAWLVVLFFLPFLNLLFFLVLCIYPTLSSEGHSTAQMPSHRPSHPVLGKIIPETDWGSAAAALILTPVLGALLTALSVKGLSVYGLGLFVATPFCLGFFAALIYGYHKPRTLRACITVAMMSLTLLGGLLLALAFEGLFCLIMAVPIAIPLAIIGALLGYQIQRRQWNSMQTQTTFGAFLLFVPLMMGADAARPQQPPLLTVTTQIEIAAPPAAVWRYLTSFPALPAPKEWPFRIGIAYPIRSALVGSGIGAQRDCEFSSGRFIEPITLWDENRRLGFRIAGEPLVMEEMSPYGHIHTLHIDGQYFQAQDALFTLTALPNGHTLLSGTSRYRNRMWPVVYWRLWSDAIVHQIHLRVFRHIKQLAEASAASTESTHALPIGAGR